MNKLTALIAGALLTLGAPSAEADPFSPTVVELFTSQGCSSCPPADELIGELARRDDVLALSFHVDYWDYIGWKDPFADPDHTRRQRLYAHNMDLRSVYTPQAVVQGTYEVVGSNRRALTYSIDRADTLRRIPVTLRRDDAGVTVEVSEAQPTTKIDVLLVMFDREHKTSVRRGENRGATLKNYNVVRAVIPLGTWDGTPTSFHASPERIAGEADACAVLLQTHMGGPILGASWISME